MSETTAVHGEVRRPSRGALMNQPDRLGLAALVVLLLGGLWVMASPFIVGYQARGVRWSHGTIDAFAVGGGVAVLALAAIVVVVGGVLFELTHGATGAHHAETEDGKPSA